MDYPLGQRLRELPGPLLLTGHTGFKGTWMTFLLEHLNVPVVGYSLSAEKDSLFDRAERDSAIPEMIADIRDYTNLEKFIDQHRPSTIIHMAAQPLVLKSYENPRETFDVNVMGTVNVLDVAFKKDFIKAIIIVTTDKVYRNDNSGRAFVESDPLEGKDPYSASKVGTESVVAAWQQIAKVSGGPNVVSVRAGNVIGGGDFARDRLIPDLVRGLISGKVVEIRNPESTRPWQHVLDPLIGYLRSLEEQIDSKSQTHLNFGPNGEKFTVETATNCVQEILKTVGKLEVNFTRNTRNYLESENLSLDSDLASKTLNWSPFSSSEVALQMTANWWVKVLKNESSITEAIHEDLRYYLESKIEK
jgi:CDP-glucose 4,6-dehydratase